MHPTALRPYSPYSRTATGCLQMTLTLYVGNAMKDLVCGPRPLGLRYGKARLKELGKGSGEAQKNAMVIAWPHTCMTHFNPATIITHSLQSNSFEYGMLAAGVRPAIVAYDEFPLPQLLRCPLRA